MKRWKETVKNFIYRQRPEQDPAEPCIVCQNLIKLYKIADLEVMALQGLELQVDAGELMAIIGSSGSGKSTLLNILGALEAPTAGRARVCGWNLTEMSRRDTIAYQRETVGFVWQNIGRNLIPYLTAYENVMLPMILAGRTGEKRWAEELLESVGLANRMKHRPAEMSGGQQQRVAIAVALANRPEVVLADEPTGALDSVTGSEILKVFRNVCERFGTTVLVVTHDRSVADAVNRVVEIRDGKISTEAVRGDAVNVPLDWQVEQDEQTHAVYSVLDSAGRLQLPKDYLKELGIEGRAIVEKTDQCITIRPPAGDKN